MLMAALVGEFLPGIINIYNMAIFFFLLMPPTVAGICMIFVGLVRFLRHTRST